MFERGMQLRKFLKHFMPLLQLKEDEKVANVSHSAFLSSLSAKGYDAEKQVIIDPSTMYNCQFVPWETYDLEYTKK